MGKVGASSSGWSRCSSLQLEPGASFPDGCGDETWAAPNGGAFDPHTASPGELLCAGVLQDMEVSPKELMDILNKVVTKRESAPRLLLLLLHLLLIRLCACVSDGNLKTDGFSIDSCRSMVAVMDVSSSAQA